MSDSSIDGSQLQRTWSVSPVLSPTSPASQCSTQSVIPASIPESDISDHDNVPDDDVPPNFQLPVCWRSEIMASLTAKDMPSPLLRSALVRDLVVHMYSYGRRPSKSFCKYAARELINKYPFLKDSIGTGYVSSPFLHYLLLNNMFQLFKFHLIFQILLSLILGLYRDHGNSG